MGEPQYLEVYFPNIDLVQVQKLKFCLREELRILSWTWFIVLVRSLQGMDGTSASAQLSRLLTYFLQTR